MIMKMLNQNQYGTQKIDLSVMRGRCSSNDQLGDPSSHFTNVGYSNVKYANKDPFIIPLAAKEISHLED